MKVYDVAVLGLGGMGSAALYHLARRGAAVCGIEQFPLVHNLGSSHGQTRIIRKAYSEHPDYIPLLHRAYELWEALQQEWPEVLYALHGLLIAGPPNGQVIPGLERTYSTHALPHERLTPSEASIRFPQFHLPEHYSVYFDPLGGYLFVERCVQAHLQRAAHYGAVILAEQRVSAWQDTANGFRISTTGGSIAAQRLVVTAGAWAGGLLADLRLPLHIWRKVMLWYHPSSMDIATPEHFPTFFLETPKGGFYGFPAVDERGIKVAEHFAPTPIAGPDFVDRSLRPEDENPVREFIAEYLPSLQGPRTAYEVCLYTMTPDQHFILDLHPDNEALILGLGFSGHGFKFSSVIGEILADLALDWRTSHPIEFLRLHRFTSFS